MPIKVACQCGQRFTAKDQLAGKTVKCPKCAQPLKIPDPSVPKVVEAEPIVAQSSLGDLLDDVGMTASQTGVRCPKCRADMSPTAVLCVQCGFDTRSGSLLKTRRGAAAADPEDDDDEDFAHLPTHDNELLNRAERQMLRDEKEQSRMQKGAPWWVFLIALLCVIGFVVYAVMAKPENPFIFGVQCFFFLIGFIIASALYAGAVNLYNALETRFSKPDDEGVPSPTIGYAVGVMMVIELAMAIPSGVITAGAAMMSGVSLQALQGGAQLPPLALVGAGLVQLPLRLMVAGLVGKVMLPTSFFRAVGVAVCQILLSIIVGIFVFLFILFVVVLMSFMS